MVVMVVEEESSRVFVPPTRLGPFSGKEGVSARAGTVHGETASTSGL